MVTVVHTYDSNILEKAKLLNKNDQVSSRNKSTFIFVLSKKNYWVITAFAVPRG